MRAEDICMHATCFNFLSVGLVASFEGNIMMFDIVCIIHQIFSKDIFMHMWQEMLANDLKLN